MLPELPSKPFKTMDAAFSPNRAGLRPEKVTRAEAQLREGSRWEEVELYCCREGCIYVFCAFGSEAGSARLSVVFVTK